MYAGDLPLLHRCVSKLVLVTYCWHIQCNTVEKMLLAEQDDCALSD